MTLSAEQIFKSDDQGQLEKVECPEWGGSVFVRVMDGTSRDRWELKTSKAIEDTNSANVRASLVCFTACDESGKRIFTDNQIAQVGKKSAIVLDRIFAVAKRLNKLDDTDIEELEKN